MRQLVVGAGEVGAALAAVLGAPARDVEPIEGAFDVLHVCIPWSEDFVEAVTSYEREHDSDLVVVHSTVPVGTCDPHEWVHSPVRGRHPYLADGLRRFPKHFGGRRAPEAAMLFNTIGISTLTHDRAADTEAGKLWELVQYGVQIQVEKAIHAWCVEQELDFDVVYTRFAETYNEGYLELGEEQFVRPILDHLDGPIGGHCVVPMSALLDHPLAEMVRS